MVNGAAGDVGSCSGFGIIDVTTGSTDIDLRINNDDGGRLRIDGVDVIDPASATATK